jgi:hypothetical protein
MAKTETADSIARKTTAALQPVVDFRVTGAHDARQDPPVVKPMPAPLATALGQTKR